jgi:two-component system sensor histidine kinase HydH
MKNLQVRKLYVPAISIIAIVILLLVLISISTFKNLDRDRKRAMELFRDKGEAVISALEAGLRAGVLIHVGDEDPVSNFIIEAGKIKDVVYLYIVDTGGVVIHHSDPSREGKKLDREFFQYVNLNEEDIAFEMINPDDPSPVYEIGKRFLPFHTTTDILDITKSKFQTAPHKYKEMFIVIGLSMGDFIKARSTDFNHAIVMAFIVLVLGTGTIFFVFVIQNYYLVNRTLKRTQSYASLIVEHMANGLLGCDNQGKIISYNQMVLDLLDFTETELRIKNINDVIDLHTIGIDITRNNCVPVFDKEIRFKRKTGEIVPLSISVTTIKHQEKCQGLVLVLRDLREIKRLEEMVRRSEKFAAIGRLSAGVAHEIRNPLSSIRGFAQLLYKFLASNPKEQSYAEIMVKEVDRINRVVTDLLTLSRPFKAELKPTNISELITHAIRLAQTDAESRNIEVVTDPNMDVSNVSIDSNQFTQALLNLLLNALQATDSGGNITIGASIDRTNALFRIWVEDTGVGISEEDKYLVFDPFYTTKTEGTGLGLSIVHRIVENHNGEIQIQSPLTKNVQGCRVTVSIPITITELV